MVDYSQTISAGGNDAANDLATKGAPFNNNVDRYIVASAFQKHTVGHRFTGVGIDQGATIDSAILSVDVIVAASAGAWSHDYVTYGADVDNIAIWASSSNEPKDVTLTTANIITTVTDADVTASPQTFTHDVKTIVQEIVDRGSWANGNSMGFITPGVSTWGISRQVTFLNYEFSAFPGRFAAKLEITISSGGERRIYIVKGT